MAQSTRDIKRRIKGIGSTTQITKAMELVSTSKLRKARRRLEATRPYYKIVLENIQNVLGSVGNIKHPLLDDREIKSTLYIVLASDRGLAGGYNSNIFKTTENDIKDKGLDTKFITVGSRTTEFFKRKSYDIVESFNGISEEPTHSDAIEIANIALDLYESNEVDEINLVYSQFVSTLSQKPEIIKLLPSEEVRQESDGIKEIIEFEPNAEKVLDYLIPKYIQSSIFGTLIEASSSEQAARRVAMESATENGEEIIEELEISYNRARQAAITMELAEIVSGAEALK